jgi:16S rRNA pseudouridine516 synthase
MFAAVGNRVVALHRERIGVLLLDESLAPGESRPLSTEEVNMLDSSRHKAE